MPSMKDRIVPGTGRLVGARFLVTLAAAKVSSGGVIDTAESLGQ